jgi:arsenate reductase
VLLVGSMRRPVRVLVLCTGNSARSQIAEALLKQRGGPFVDVASAGSSPAERVDPLALEVLADAGIDWTGRVPKGIDDVIDRRWDVVVTVCDRARDACPVLPGHPLSAHWGLPDPSAVAGTQAERRRAFEATHRELARRIDQLLAPPLDALDPAELRRRFGAIDL